MRAVLIAAAVLAFGCKSSSSGSSGSSVATPPPSSPHAPVPSPSSGRRPSGAPPAWPTDPVAALADGVAHERPTLILFCAEWSNVCAQLYATLADPTIVRELADHFVTARVDVTYDDAPHLADYVKKFAENAVPLLIVFDKSGHESARHDGDLDLPTLHTLLTRVE